MKSMRTLFRGVAATVACLVGGAGAGSAQTPVAPLASEFESRADLEAQARTAESQHRTSEAWLLRNRLEKGDFQEGDRIVVTPHSSATTQSPETLTVRAGKYLPINKMEELPLEGVLRSELHDRFVAHLAKFLQDPEARVIPLMRLNITGGVNRPGYFDTSADLLLSDMIMRAGGPSGDADLNKVIIRRGPTVIWHEDDMRTALTDGMSIDRLHLRAGDQIVVGVQHHIAWLNLISVSLGLATLAFTLIRLR
jgi:hypothetical protein